MATPRGVIALNPAACTSCLLCVKQCPTQCISLERHQEPDPTVPAGARQRLVHVLDDFAIDFSLCMNCSICVEVCPFDALTWAAEFDYAKANRAGLRHDLPMLASHWPESRSEG